MSKKSRLSYLLILILIFIIQNNKAYSKKIVSEFYVNHDKIQKCLKTIYLTDPYDQSGPLLENEKLYWSDGGSFFYSLKKSSGEINWIFEAKRIVENIYDIFQNNIFISDISGKLYALDKETGKLKWTYLTTGTKLQTSIGIQNRLLYIIKDTGIHVLDIITGKLVDKINHTHKILALKKSLDSDNLYFCCSNNTIHSINLLTKNKNWELKLNFDLKSVNNILIYKNTLIVISYYQVQVFNKHTAEEIWAYKTNEITGQPIIYKKHLYFCSFNELISLNLEEKKLVWNLIYKGNVYNQPEIKDDRLYFGTDEGYLYIIDIETRKILSNIKLPFEICTTPVIDGKSIFVGCTDGKLYKIQ